MLVVDVLLRNEMKLACYDNSIQVATRLLNV